MRGEDRFVFSPQTNGYLGGQPSQDPVFRVHQKPIFLNFSQLKGNQLTEIVKAGSEFVTENIKEIPLLLVDISNSFLNQETSNISKNNVKLNKEFIKKQAVVGVTGIKKVIVKAIIQFVSKNTRLFDTLEHALEWITVD